MVILRSLQAGWRLLGFDIVPLVPLDDLYSLRSVAAVGHNIPHADLDGKQIKFLAGAPGAVFQLRRQLNDYICKYVHEDVWFGSTTFCLSHSIPGRPGANHVWGQKTTEGSILFPASMAKEAPYAIGILGVQLHSFHSSRISISSFTLGSTIGFPVKKHVRK